MSFKTRFSWGKTWIFGIVIFLMATGVLSYWFDLGHSVRIARCVAFVALFLAVLANFIRGWRNPERRKHPWAQSGLVFMMVMAMLNALRRELGVQDYGLEIFVPVIYFWGLVGVCILAGEKAPCSGDTGTKDDAPEK